MISLSLLTNTCTVTGFDVSFPGQAYFCWRPLLVYINRPDYTCKSQDIQGNITLYPQSVSIIRNLA